MNEQENNAIKVESISKSFKLPHEKNSSIKTAVINFYKRNKSYETQEVLNSISFEIKKGEFFGIVGRNGSGKSTLLKLLAGIYVPDSGVIKVNGKLTPFIELGVGFSPELSGRENVFLNGALLGFNRREMEAMYEDVVEFAELERFMDQKLKNYSSGMQVRLAFSIAIRANTDILVLDEVLAVGDEAFQRKCFDYFEQLKAKKQTVVLVTHDMRAVEQFCTKALLIKNGKINCIGSPFEVAEEYIKINQEQIKKQGHVRHTPTAKTDTMLRLEKNGTKTQHFNVGDTMQIKLSWKKQGVTNVGVSIHKQSGERIFSTNTFDTKLQDKIKANKKSTYSVDLHLAPGTYYLRARLMGDSPHQTIELIDEGPVFDIFTDNQTDKGSGITRLPHEWL